MNRSRRFSPVSLLLPAWEALARESLGRFLRGLPRGVEQNEATLRAILRRHAGSEVGRQQRFAHMARLADLGTAWREALPVQDYAGFREPIARIADGARDVLFPGRPPLLVSTSGTTADPKLFPVTRRQQNQALRYIALLTPAARARAVPGLGFRAPVATLMVASRPGQVTAAGIPVGNPSGAGIRRIRPLAPPFWVFPPAVLGVRHYPSALYLHALFALRAGDLGCIEAIYSSHVVNWAGLILARGEELVRDIADGTLSAQLDLGADERAVLAPDLYPDPARARAVAQALAGGEAGVMGRLWPELKAVSAVISGAFAASRPRLRALAGPGPMFYTTCFGATEGMIGINLDINQPEHYVLALGACHFEFVPEDELGAASPRAVGVDRLEQGARYEVVITNHAGLYRYRLGDVVRIEGRTGTTPVFSFAWRLGNVIDLVGEKTSEQHLGGAVAALLAELPGAGLSGEFCCWPDLARLPYRYVVYVERPVEEAAWPPEAALASRLDELLQRENPSYASLARRNGRLAELELRCLPPGSFEALVQRQRDASGGASVNQAKLPRLLRSAAQRDLLESLVRNPPG
jgi:hypothetical protein